MKKAIFLIGFYMFLSSGLGFFFANSHEDLKQAPVNPGYVEYLDQFNRGIYKHYTDNGHPLGHIPSPVDMSHFDRVPVQRDLVSD